MAKRKNRRKEFREMHGNSGAIGRHLTPKGRPITKTGPREQNSPKKVPAMHLGGNK